MGNPVAKGSNSSLQNRTISLSPMGHGTVIKLTSHMFWNTNVLRNMLKIGSFYQELKQIKQGKSSSKKTKSQTDKKKVLRHEHGSDTTRPVMKS